MKTSLFGILCGTIAALILVPTASAATIYDPFPYANGDLNGNVNATAPATENGFSDTNVWTSSTANAATVIDGDLTYPNLPTTATNHMAQLHNATANPERIGIGEYPVGSTIYFSMLLQVPAGVTNFGTSTTTGSFLTGLQYNPSTLANSAMNSGPAGAGGVLTVHTATDGLGYNLGIAFRDVPAGTSRVFDNSHEFHAGDTVFLVGKYVMNSGSQDDVASLFLNPDPTGAEPAAANAVSDASVILAGSTTNYDYMYNNADGTQLETNIRSIFLRSNGVEPANMNIDELRIGSSWAAVTGQVVVPEPAILSLIAVGLAAGGLFGTRRRDA